jgi:hypothetical protein
MILSVFSCRPAGKQVISGEWEHVNIHAIPRLFLLEQSQRPDDTQGFD